MTVFSNQTYIFRLSGSSPKVANAKKEKEKKERENETNKKTPLFLGLRFILLALLSGNEMKQGDSERYWCTVLGFPIYKQVAILLCHLTEGSKTLQIAISHLSYITF